MTGPSMNRYFQLNATIDITHKDGAMHKMDDVLAWLAACLNCNTNFAEVTILQPVERLDWPDFLDAPGYGPEHPDYAGDVAALEKVNHWLTLDRKELISELGKQYNQAEYDKRLVAREAETNALNANKAQALDRLMTQLSEAGFDADDGINGGDCVELVDEIYKRLKKQFPR